MKWTLGVLLLGLLLGSKAAAHRLDEYLQGTLIELKRGSIEIEIQMVPGVAVLQAVMEAIDLDGDGRISAGEGRAYGERVARDVELRVDGAPVKVSVREVQFPSMEALREGVGRVRIALRAEARGHAVRFENNHMPRGSVYLVNCLAAAGDGLTVTKQVRDVQQRSIELEYSFSGTVKAR